MDKIVGVCLSIREQHFLTWNATNKLAMAFASIRWSLTYPESCISTYTARPRVKLCRVKKSKEHDAALRSIGVLRPRYQFHLMSCKKDDEKTLGGFMVARQPAVPFSSFKVVRKDTEGRPQQENSGTRPVHFHFPAEARPTSSKWRCRRETGEDLDEPLEKLGSTSA